MVKDVSINEYLGAENRRRDLRMVELGGRHCGLLKIRSGWLATASWSGCMARGYLWLDAPPGMDWREIKPESAAVTQTCFQMVGANGQPWSIAT